MSKNIVLGIDPGPKEHAFVWWDWQEKRVIELQTRPSFEVLYSSTQRSLLANVQDIACEWFGNYSKTVGQEVFRTVASIGWLASSLNRPVRMVTRLTAKMHLCHDSKSGDPQVRMALIDRFGIQGTKKAPGPLYGVTSHYLSALAVAVYAAETPAKDGEYWIEDLRRRSIV